LTEVTTDTTDNN